MYYELSLLTEKLIQEFPSIKLQYDKWTFTCTVLGVVISEFENSKDYEHALQLAMTEYKALNHCFSLVQAHVLVLESFLKTKNPYALDFSDVLEYTRQWEPKMFENYLQIFDRISILLGTDPKEN